MLASNLHRKQEVRPPMYRSQTRQASLDFLANFRQQQRPVIKLKSERIEPKEPAYLITELPNGDFKVYGIESSRVRDNKTAFTSDERTSIIDAMPFEEQFVAIERGFNFEVSEDRKEITVLLGEDWLFAIWVDEEAETYMIERNTYLDPSTDIGPMIRAAGLAFRMALEEK